MTNRATIEEILRKRVEETKNWVNDHQGGELYGVKFRDKPARLEIIKFLNDDRVEANGVRFRLFYGNDARQYFTDLDVRFNPNWVMAEGKDDTAPYIAVYALDKNGAGDLLKVFYILDPSQVNGDIELGDWYVSFINRSMRRGEDVKIMGCRNKVETT